MPHTAIDEVVKTTTAFKILSDPTRFRMLCLLAREKEGLCVGELAEAVGVSHSAASHQLAKLEAHRVVVSFRKGQEVCYELEHNEFTQNLLRVMKVFNYN